MAVNGVKTTDLVTVPSTDALLGNHQGSTVQILAANVAAQIRSDPVFSNVPRLPEINSVAELKADTSLTYSADQAGSVVAGDIVVTRADGLALEVMADGVAGVVQNIATPPVHFKPAKNSISDIRIFGGYEGDGGQNRDAILAAVDYLSTGGTIFFPDGYWPIAAGTDIVTTADDLWLVGAGAKTHIEFDGCAFKYDAVAKGTHLFRSGIRDMSISRIGTAGPVLHLNGQNLMGISRFSIRDVHVRGSSASSGDGILAQGAWSSNWFGGSVSGCLNGFRGKLAVDGNSSANAWCLYGLEVQGNVTGVRLDTASYVDISATIEGNSGHGLVLENNCRGIRAHLYCEGNGSSPDHRDILVGDVNYTGTKNTGFGCQFSGEFSDAGKGKNCAIEFTRMNTFVVKDSSSMSGYAQGGVMVNPEGGAVARVDGKVEAVALIAGTPEAIIDSAGARYTGNKVKPDAASSVQTHSLVFDPPLVTSGATVTVTAVATGVKAGDHVISASSAVNRLGCEVFFRATADDEITMYVSNAAATDKDLGAATWEIVTMDQRFAS